MVGNTQAEGNNDNSAGEYSPNIKAMKTPGFRGKVGRAAAVSLLLLNMAYSSACTKKASTPAPTVQASQEPALTPTVTVEPTLTVEEIREQRLNEIAEAVKTNDYRFTVEELDEYLAKKGRVNSIGSAIDKWKGSSAPFQYYFANDEDIGYLIYPAIYIQGSTMTLNDFTQNDIIPMVDEREVGEVVESIYHYLDYMNPDGTLGYDEEPVKYTVVFYMTQELGENGELHDVIIPNIGGYFFKNVVEKVKHVDYDDAVNGNLTDEEMEFFTDDVLVSLKAKEGWTMFIFDEDGNLEKKEFNAKDFYNLLHPAISSDTAAQEME